MVLLTLKFYIYEKLITTGSQLGILYGLAKVHKIGVNGSTQISPKLTGNRLLFQSKNDKQLLYTINWIFINS